MTGIRLTALAAVVCCLLAAGCDTKNVWQPGPIVDRFVTVTVPDQMAGGQAATWMVTWAWGASPFTISLDMGGGTTSDVSEDAPATNPFTQTFTMVNPSAADSATYTYKVTVTDSLGVSSTATATYSIEPTPNSTPVIESAVYPKATSTLLVTVSDPDDNETLTVDVTVPEGLAVDAASKVASATGPLTASFVWRPADFIAGGSGTTTVTVTDSAGATASTGVEISFPLTTVADTLYAIPSPTSVAVGEPVTVVVITSVPAHPIQFINAIGLTMPDDSSFVPSSINYGAIGGSATAVDGFWAAMNPGGFMLQPDDLMVPTPIGGGRERWDFNITPLGGSNQTTDSGALFNVQFIFSTPGVKTFSFQEADAASTKRTYYSDGEGNEYFWGAIGNEQAPTVTVY